MREVWATYSVRDHLSRKPFVADVMLYDRLVIPVPAEGDGEVWKDRQPEKQERLLSILGDRAVPVVWDKQLRNEWRSRWEAAKALGTQTSRAAFLMTPNVLLQKVPPRASGVIAVATFESADELRKGTSMTANPNIVDGKYSNLGGHYADGQLAAIIGREFLAPDDPMWGDEDLLKAALDVSTNDRFRRKRAAYWRWQREFLGNAVVLSQDTVQEAVEEMADLIAAESAEARRARIKLGVSFAFAVAGASVGLLTGPLAPLAVGGAFVSVGGWIFDHATDKADAPGPAAMCHSVQGEFGWQRRVH